MKKIDNIFYIGDECSVQLFTKVGFCRQRLGDTRVGANMNQFSYVFGITLMNNELYISDYSNNRVQIFMRLE